jgi:hypothetical protein
VFVYRGGKGPKDMVVENRFGNVRFLIERPEISK